ncbi:uncharacterized protein G2W53_014226 [Senna tora]|uniref:Uncharacterized protein n=1 Tax=Senna tora TaxID=362788 RepID=A0A834WT03_9FABA|nr:uncharacterized protein G2W53_014226 [Senna tora]
MNAIWNCTIPGVFRRLVRLLQLGIEFQAELARKDEIALSMSSTFLSPSATFWSIIPSLLFHRYQRSGPSSSLLKPSRRRHLLITVLRLCHLLLRFESDLCLDDSSSYRIYQMVKLDLELLSAVFLTSSSMLIPLVSMFQ